jgi:hypothetical protein
MRSSAAIEIDIFGSTAARSVRDHAQCGLELPASPFLRETPNAVALSCWVQFIKAARCCNSSAWNREMGVFRWAQQARF